MTDPITFRLAYIIEIEKEVDDVNIGKTMYILQRDFLDNQITIASIYHYVQNENVIELKERLLDQMT